MCVWQLSYLQIFWFSVFFFVLILSCLYVCWCSYSQLFVVVHFNFHICLVYTHWSRAKKKVGGGRIAPIPCSHTFFFALTFVCDAWLFCRRGYNIMNTFSCVHDSMGIVDLLFCFKVSLCHHIWSKRIDV